MQISEKKKLDESMEKINGVCWFDYKPDDCCEQADTCKSVTERCRHTITEFIIGALPKRAETICAQKRRWMYCDAYKQKLGMVFDKDLGVYILPEWKEELMKRAGK